MRQQAMAIKSKSGHSWLSVLFIILAVALWFYDTTRQIKPTNPAPAKTSEASHSSLEKVGGYEVYRDCTLAEAKNNDGDSFIARLPDGRRAEFRLYFVDTPESDFKSYANGENNHDRIRDQARDMGGLKMERAVQIGKKAKDFTLELLGNRPFTIHTKWDSPFGDDRFHAHIEVTEKGEARWLHRILVQQGLVRIKTKPADLPDGTSAAGEISHLRGLEREAKRARLGTWQ